MGRLSLLGVLLAGMLVLPGGARADNFEEFGFGSRAQAMGNAFTGLATDATATYYNPAGLIYSRHINLTLGFSFADYALDFDSDRGGRRDDAAERIPDLSAFTIGLSTSIDLDIKDRIGVGVAIFTPTRGVVDLDARATTSDPEWFQYGSRHDRLDLLTAVGIKITKGFSIGFGTSLLVGAVGGTTISAGLTTPVNPEFKAKVRPSVRGIVGLRLDPSDYLTIGLTYRSEVKIEVEFPAVALVQGLNIPIKLESTQFFSPHQLQLGAALFPTDWLLVTFDLLWAQWSAFEDTFLEVESSVSTVVPKVDAKLRDVFSPRLGAELVLSDWLLVRGGYWYRSSAVPDQDTKLTNLVDSAKHVFTLGLGFAFGNLPGEEDDELDDELEDEKKAKKKKKKSKKKKGKKKKGKEKKGKEKKAKKKKGKKKKAKKKKAKKGAEAGKKRKKRNKRKKKKRAQTLKEALKGASLDLDLFFQLHWHPRVSASKPATDPIGSWDADGYIVNFGLTLTFRF